MSNSALLRLTKPVYLYQAAVLITVSFILRLILGHYLPGFRTDQMLFVQWSDAAGSNGLAGAYLQNRSINYPPLFLLLLEGYRHLLALFGLVPEAGKLSFKLLLLLIDLAAMILAARVMSRLPAAKWRLFILILFVFNPALFTDSAVWGQVEMLHGILMAAAVLALPGKPWASGALFALALLTKFQAIAVLPVIGIYLLAVLIWKKDWRAPLQWIGGAAVPIAVMAIYFQVNGALTAVISQAYSEAVGSFPAVTVNAMNSWYNLLGTRPSDSDTQVIVGGITLRMAGLGLFGVGVLLICGYVMVRVRKIIALRSEDSKPMEVEERRMVEVVLLRAGAAIGFAFFMLPTEIHERYGVPALLFLVFAAMYSRGWAVAAAGVTLTTFVNLVVVLQASGGGRLGGQGEGRGLPGRGSGGVRGSLQEGVQGGGVGSAPGGTQQGVASGGMGSAPGGMQEGAASGGMGSAPGGMQEGVASGGMGSAPGGMQEGAASGGMGSAPGGMQEGMASGGMGSAPGGMQEGMANGGMGSAPGSAQGGDAGRIADGLQGTGQGSSVGWHGMGGAGHLNSNVLTNGYTWVAVVNVLLLLFMFWLLWRDVRRGAGSGISENREVEEVTEHKSS